MPRANLLSVLESGFDAKKITSGQAFFCGAAIAFGLQQLLALLTPGSVINRTKLAILRFIRVIAEPIVNKEIDKASANLGFFNLPDEEINDALPAKGRPYADVLKQCHELHDILDVDWKDGKLSGTVYHGSDDYTTFMNDVMAIFQWSNPLHIDTFNSVRKMEAEVTQMVLRMFRGHTERPDACAAMTSGGSESICMSLKAHRDWAAVKKNIGPGDQPTVVAPVTCHPAFDKGCSYYGLRLIKVPVDAVKGCVDATELERYISWNTILIVGSAPNFPNGTVDPIADLGKLAVKHNVGFHVDACLGGFLTQFLDQVPECENPPVVDFRVEGVTAISCDTHKFGYSPKGTSVVMYASKDLRRYQFFATAEWPGGLYASPSASGSKPGNCIAGTWAAMIHFGNEGYVAAARAIYLNLQKCTKFIESEVPELEVIGNPSVCAVAFTSSTVDIYKVSDRLALPENGGFKLNSCQFPVGVQFSLTYIHTRDGIMDNFLKHLKKVVAELKAEREALGPDAPKIGADGPSMYGSQQKVADRSIICDVTKRFFEGYYETHHPVKDVVKTKPSEILEPVQSTS